MDEINLKLTFENNWNRSCLIIDASVPYTEDYQLKMLKNNSIPGILKISGNGLEGSSRYTYQIQGMISFSQKYKEQKISFSTLTLLIGQMIQLTHNLTDYLLNPDCILLRPDCIFESEHQYYFCYVPSFSNSISNTFLKLTEFIVQNLDYNDDNGILLACLLHKETLQKNYHLETILQNCQKETEKRKELLPELVQKLPEPEIFEEVEDESLNPFPAPSSAASDLTSKSVSYPAMEDSMPLMEEPRYRPIKRLTRKIKNSHWGDWNDLITESDDYHL